MGLCGIGVPTPAAGHALIVKALPGRAENGMAEPPSSPKGSKAQSPAFLFLVGSSALFSWTRFLA